MLNVCCASAGSSSSALGLQSLGLSGQAPSSSSLDAGTLSDTTASGNCTHLTTKLLLHAHPAFLLLSLHVIVSSNFQSFSNIWLFSMYKFVCTFRNPPLSKACCFFPVTALVMLSAPASDDEGSTAATDGSTLRTSPAEHGGSVGSESGGSAVDSVAGEHNGKT